MSQVITLMQIRVRLQELLQTVPGVGVVHLRERYFQNEKQFREMYLHTLTDPALDAWAGDSHIRGWHIRRVTTDETVHGANVLNEHTWQVRGYMSFKDEIGSELIFDELVERMRETVRWNTSLGLPGLGGAMGKERGVQLVNAGPVYFCSALCHSALLQLKTVAQVERPRS